MDDLYQNEEKLYQFLKVHLPSNIRSLLFKCSNDIESLRKQILLQQRMIHSFSLLSIPHYPKKHVPEQNKLVEFIFNQFQTPIASSDIPSEFIQDASIFIPHIYDNLGKFADSIIRCAKSQYFDFIVTSSIPSIFGNFSSDEYAKLASVFYTHIVGKAPPELAIQILAPFFQSLPTFRFIECVMTPFSIHYGSEIRLRSIAKSLNSKTEYNKSAHSISIQLLGFIQKYLPLIPTTHIVLLNLMKSLRWSQGHLNYFFFHQFFIHEAKKWIESSPYAGNSDFFHQICKDAFTLDEMGKIISNLSKVISLNELPCLCQTAGQSFLLLYTSPFDIVLLAKVFLKESKNQQLQIFRETLKLTKIDEAVHYKSLWLKVFPTSVGKSLMPSPNWNYSEYSNVDVSTFLQNKRSVFPIFVKKRNFKRKISSSSDMGTNDSKQIKISKVKFNTIINNTNTNNNTNNQSNINNQNNANTNNANNQNNTNTNDTNNQSNINNQNNTNTNDTNNQSNINNQNNANNQNTNNTNDNNNTNNGNNTNNQNNANTLSQSHTKQASKNKTQSSPKQTKQSTSKQTTIKTSPTRSHTVTKPHKNKSDDILFCQDDVNLFDSNLSVTFGSSSSTTANTTANDYDDDYIYSDSSLIHLDDTTDNNFSTDTFIRLSDLSKTEISSFNNLYSIIERNKSVNNLTVYDSIVETSEYTISLHDDEKEKFRRFALDKNLKGLLADVGKFEQFFIFEVQRKILDENLLRDSCSLYNATFARVAIDESYDFLTSRLKSIQILSQIRPYLISVQKQFETEFHQLAKLWKNYSEEVKENCTPSIFKSLSEQKRILFWDCVEQLKTLVIVPLIFRLEVFNDVMKKIQLIKNKKEFIFNVLIMTNNEKIITSFSLFSSCLMKCEIFKNLFSDDLISMWVEFESTFLAYLSLAKDQNLPLLFINIQSMLEDAISPTWQSFKSEFSNLI